MTFVVTSERDAPPVRYEKVGRLRAGENGMIDIIRDGQGVICSIATGDCILTLNGLQVDGLSLSESGNQVEIEGPDGREYFVLAKQVRGMIQSWPKGKAALFVMD